MRSRLLPLVAALFLLAPGVALAEPAPPAPPVGTVTQPPAPVQTPGIAAAPDDLQQLNGGRESPACTTGASVQVIRNCAASGEPQSAYPAGNYGLDTNVNTGLTDPSNDFDSIVQSLMGDLFAGIAALLSLIFDGLTLAFNFDLFSHGGQYLPSALTTAENQFTFPILPAALVIGGGFGLWHMAKSNEARALGHFATMTALIIAGLVLISDPAGTLGWFDGIANQAAQGSLSAFSGAGGGTTGSYADATPALWRTMLEEPWCALEFGDVANWCMAPITPAMAAARASTLQNLALAQVGSAGVAAAGTAGLVAAAQQGPIETLRLADATTNGELFLSFPPNWDARNGGTDSWTLYHEIDTNNFNQLAVIRTAGGVGERITNLFIVAIGLTFFVLLLVYVASYLLVAAIFFVVLLMLAPVMVIAPCFGEVGQRAFGRWCGFLVGSLAVKLVMATYLGLMIGLSTLMVEIGPSIGGPGAWLMQWLLFAALWAIAWHFRKKLPEMILGKGHASWHGQKEMSFGMGTYIGTRLARGTRKVGSRNSRPAPRQQEDYEPYDYDYQPYDEPMRDVDDGHLVSSDT